MKSLITAGVDEAGRGPLAGPVVAAAVILDPSGPSLAVRDSKQMTAGHRERLAGEIRRFALAWAVAEANVAEIARLNILGATLLAMQRAVSRLAIPPQMVHVDGNRLPKLPVPARAVIGGDRLEPAISAASILAKVARDAYMIELDQRFPGYGFARHKGYPTHAHVEALTRYGPCVEHRVGFAPVRAVLEKISKGRS